MKKKNVFNIQSINLVAEKVLVPYTEDRLVESISKNLKERIHKMADELAVALIDQYDVKAVFKEEVQKKITSKNHELEIIVSFIPKVRKNDED